MSDSSFEWDEAKDSENHLKHGVSFGQAQHAFLTRIVLLPKTLGTVMMKKDI